MTRAARAAEAARLHGERLNGIQIAERMGISRSYAYELLNDPAGVAVRARKASYAGACVDCGAPTDGSNGTASAPTRCASCAAAFSHDAREWTQTALADATRRFVARYGRRPTYNRDWADPDCPHQYAILREFGSWNAAMAAAGLEPIPHGQNQPPSERAAIVDEAVRLYRSGLSLVQVGERMGYSGGGIGAILRQAGEPCRPARRYARVAA